VHSPLTAQVVDVAQLERDGDLCGLVRVLKDASADSVTKADAAVSLSNLGPYTNATNRALAIPPLVKLLRGTLVENGRVMAPWMAAGALGNLAAADYGNETKNAILAAGAVPLLVDLLRSGGLEKGRGFAALGLANLACSRFDADRAAITAAVAAAGALPL
jgi:hypothetical protein